ncbi:hypothetical protein ACS0TY_005164 [Phlomoides rotata]
MERNGGERRSDHFATAPSFAADGGHFPYDDRQDHFYGGQHQPDHRQHHNFNGHQNESTGYHLNNDSNNSLPLSGHKRQFPHPNNADYGFVKLYVVGIPRTATELDVSSVFGEFGDILEVVLLKDKRTGFQQECCFVKYAAIEQAEQAIVAFNSQYTFPGALIPLKVKYADGEHERLGFGGPAHNHKLYIGCVNRQALKREIEDIFSPFGFIEEVFIVRDEFKQNRGCAFVQYSCRDMAMAAIHALHGIYVMRGCDQPLIVRFADPKKPRIGDSRRTPYVNDPSGVHVLSNEKQQMKSSHSGCSMEIMTNNQSSHSGCNMEVVTNNDTAPAFHAFDSIPGAESSVECDWSEHVSPDGELYYYNSITCESRWEMPEEYALYEQELDILEERQLQESKPHLLSSPEVSATQKV